MNTSNIIYSDISMSSVFEYYGERYLENFEKHERIQ